MRGCLIGRECGLACATLKSREIQIAGGGLAGLSLALGLRKRGIGVVVSEAGDYPRHRVCGEFVSGVADATLEALGVGEAFDGSRRPRRVRWTRGGRVVFEGKLPEPARAVSRHRLDGRLARMLGDAGGELRTGRRVDAAAGAGWVRASGRVKRGAGSRIGLKAHARGVALRAELEMHAGTNGYAGMVEVEDGWVNVCGIFRVDRRVRGRGAELLAGYLEAGGNAGLAEIVRGAEIREGSFCAVAGFETGRQPGGEGELCIGDAERMIPPFTGNGMSMAFEAAECALDPLAAWARGGLSWEAACGAVRAALARRFRRRMAAAAMIEPWLGRPAVAGALGLLPSAVPTRAVLPFLR